jgi:hypothetical protein
LDLWLALDHHSMERLLRVVPGRPSGYLLGDPA